MWCTSAPPASARRPETRWRFHLSRCPGFGVHFYSPIGSVLLEGCRSPQILALVEHQVQHPLNGSKFLHIPTLEDNLRHGTPAPIPVRGLRDFAEAVRVRIVEEPVEVILLIADPDFLVRVQEILAYDKGSPKRPSERLLRRGEAVQRIIKGGVNVDLRLYPSFPTDKLR